MPRIRVSLFGLVPIILLALTLEIQSDPTCCVGRVGDVDGYGGDEPTIGDVSRLVDRLFINPQNSLACPAEADINGSGFPDPTEDDLSIGDIGLLVDYLFITGSGLGLRDCPDPPNGPYGYLQEMGECKMVPADGDYYATADLSCIQWQYLGGNLAIAHTDAGFNCCPEVDFDITIDGSVITITETETAGLCDCLCLFDLKFLIINLEPGTYELRIVEPYAPPDEAMPPITLELGVSPIGMQCVPRSTYPWEGGSMFGYLVSHSGCKPMGAPAAASAADNEACIVYSYDPALERLTFRHENAVFNCCPAELIAEYQMEENSITVVAGEILEDPCFCLCLYDVDHVLTGVPPGVYQFAIDELYTAEGPPLELMMDLTEAVSDAVFCVPRDGYPWGEMSY